MSEQLCKCGQRMVSLIKIKGYKCKNCGLFLIHDPLSQQWVWLQPWPDRALKAYDSHKPLHVYRIQVKDRRRHQIAMKWPKGAQVLRLVLVKVVSGEIPTLVRVFKKTGASPVCSVPLVGYDQITFAPGMPVQAGHSDWPLNLQVEAKRRRRVDLDLQFLFEEG